MNRETPKTKAAREKLSKRKQGGEKSTRTMFEKYPGVESIGWDQYEDLGGYFLADPWTVLVNGKAVLSGDKLNDQEWAAAIEIENLMILAVGGTAGAGSVDISTPTAIHTGNLLRAIFGNNVAVSIHRDGSIKLEPSRVPANLEAWAELRKEEEARELAFTAHISKCNGCTAVVDADGSRR